MLLFKETYCAFKVNIFSVDAFPGILAHDLGVASTMIYQFSGSRMYTKMPCVILIWIKHFFFNSTSSSGWLVLLLESTLRYCKLLHKEECLAKNIFYHSHILKTYTVHYMRHYSDRRMHSATIWLQHRAIKETQKSFGLSAIGLYGTSSAKEMNNLMFFHHLHVDILSVDIACSFFVLPSFVMIYVVCVYCFTYLVIWYGKSTFVINLSLHIHI